MAMENCKGCGAPHEVEGMVSMQHALEKLVAPAEGDGAFLAYTELCQRCQALLGQELLQKQPTDEARKTLDAFEAAMQKRVKARAG